MTRLPFRLREYPPRITWASEQARSVWEPRISRISQQWQEVERVSVQEGLRPSCLQFVSPSELPTYMADAARRGLVALPLAQVPNNETVAAPEGFSYRVALTKYEAKAWPSAWADRRDDFIGELLGYPSCCRAFFDRVWNKERWFDTTVPQAAQWDQRTYRYCNLLWRWLGVRLVSHLPCSFTCHDTRLIGEQMLKVFETVDPDAAFWVWEMLDWPVRYTSLHGIAEITSPIHRMHVATDALAEKVTVDYHGKGYPKEGATGTGFPHRTAVKAAANALAPVVQPLILKRPNQNPQHNGFSNTEAQNAAHAKLLAALPNATWNCVLDLGCGDGTLLAKVAAKRRVGIESEPERAVAAGKRLDRVVLGDCCEEAMLRTTIQQESPDLIIAQAHRNDRNDPLFHGRAVLSYSYDAPQFVSFYPA